MLISVLKEWAVLYGQYCIPIPNFPLSEPCGMGIIDLSSGPYVLSSIGYPGHYPVNIHCLWHVYARQGENVLVVIHDFVTEKGYDFLTISHGSDSLEITGEDYPERLSFFSEDIWIDFRTDYEYQKRGFNLTLKGTDTGE